MHKAIMWGTLLISASKIFSHASTLFKYVRAGRWYGTDSPDTTIISIGKKKELLILTESSCAVTVEIMTNCTYLWNGPGRGVG